MGLLKPDLFRAFFAGFGVTAVAMGVQIAPNLI